MAGIIHQGAAFVFEPLTPLNFLKVLTKAANSIPTSSILHAGGCNFYRRDADAKRREKYKILSGLCASAVFNILLTSTQGRQIQPLRVSAIIPLSDSTLPVFTFFV